MTSTDNTTQINTDFYFRPQDCIAMKQDTSPLTAKLFSIQFINCIVCIPRILKFLQNQDKETKHIPMNEQMLICHAVCLDGRVNGLSLKVAS